MVYAMLIEQAEVSDDDGDDGSGGCQAAGQDDDAFKIPLHTRASPFTQLEYTGKQNRTRGVKTREDVCIQICYRQTSMPDNLADAPQLLYKAL